MCDHMGVCFLAIPQQSTFHYLDLALGQLNESTVSQLWFMGVNTT